MKVMTLNTHSWMEENPLNKLSEIATWIANQEIEIIALQEINQLISTPIVEPDDYFCPLADQVAIHEDNFAYLLVEELAKLGVHYYWSWTYAHIGYDIYEEGLAILAKSPLQASAFIASIEKDPHKLARKQILAQLNSSLGTLTVLSGHYSWAGVDGFDYEWQQTVERLKEQTTPLLLMGDFNNPANTREHQMILDSPLQLKDAFLASSNKEGEHTVVKAIDGWSENTQKLRIDYVFLDKMFHVKQYKVIFDGKKQPMVSDHAGLLVEFSK